MSTSSARSLKAHDDEYEGDRAHTAAAPAANRYDPDSVQQRTAILTTIYRDLSAVRDNAEVIAHYAGFACEVAVFVHAHCGVDLGNLTLPIEDGPLEPSHPVSKVLPALEVWIADYFNSLGTDTAKLGDLDPQEKMQRLATQARMRAACVWKGYLLALNIHPTEWRIDAACALGALAILSVADAGKIVGAQRAPNKAAYIRDHVRDDDWPPRAFIDLYLSNEDLLTDKLQALRSQE